MNPWETPVVTGIHVDDYSFKTTLSNLWLSMKTLNKFR